MSFNPGSVVDSKVVEMSMENSQFESNAEKSISTLGRLKEALRFSDSTDGLDEVNSSLQNIKVGPLTQGVNALRGAFDNLAQTAGFAAIVRYTNQALGAIENLVGSVTVGASDMAAGWQKFGDKTTSVATLVAQGYEIEQVNEQLEKLNWFTDETSYNFIDMVSSISKFTASGQGLEDSVKAMEGIANWAALSGQNASKASAAMYQISQAMGAGVMRKEDYKSIQNVSMDTDEFRQHALDAAVALGKLKENADGTYESLVATENAGKEAFSKQQFTEMLTRGEWFDKDVMMKVFGDYSAAVDQIYEYSEERGITASEALQEAGDQFDEFGVKAFKAAQQARTWGDVVDSLKDASSTAFMNMFELIFGNAEEATELFTNMANSLYDVFVEPINSINEILGEALGVQDVEKVIDSDAWDNLGLAGDEAEALTKSLRKVGEECGVAFENDSVESFVKSLESGWLTSDKLKETIDSFGKSDGLETSAEDLAKIREAALAVIKGDYSTNMEQRMAELKEAGFEDPQVVQDYVNTLHKLAGGTWNITDAILEEADATVNLTSGMSKLSDEELAAAGYSEAEIAALRNLAEQAGESDSALSQLTEGEETVSGREKLLANLGKAVEGVSKIFETVKQAFSMIFPPATADTITSIIDKIGELADAFNKFARKNQHKIRNIFLGIFSAIDLVVRIVKTFVSGGLKLLADGLKKVGLLDFLSKVGLLIKQFRDWIVENEIIEKTFAKIAGAIETVRNTIIGWLTTLYEIPAVKKIVDSFRDAFTNLFKNFGPTITSSIKIFKHFFRMVTGLFSDLIHGKISFKEFFGGIVDEFKKLGKRLLKLDGFKGFAEAFGNLKNLIKEKFDGVTEIIKGWYSSLRSKLGDSAAGKALDWIVSKFQTAVQMIKDLLSGKALGDGESGAGGLLAKIKEKFSIGKIFDVIGDFFNTAIDLFSKIPFGKILKLSPMLLGLGTVLVIAKKLAVLFVSGKTVLNSISGFFDSLSDGVNSIFNKGRDPLSKFERVAKAIRTLAISIGILVAAVVVLAMLEPDKLKQGLIALGVVAGIMLAVSAIESLIDKYLTKGKSKGKGVVGMAVALFLMALALSKLAKIKSKRLRQAEEAIIVLAAIMIVLMLVSKISSKGMRGSVKFGAMVGIAVAIYVMAMAFAKLAKIKPKRMRQAEEAIIVLAAIMAVLMLVSKLSAKSMKGSVKFGAMLGIAVAIYIMAMAFSKLAKIKPKRLRQAEEAIIVIGVVLAALMLIGKISAGAMKGSAKFGAMLGIAAAIYIMAMAFVKLADIKPKRLKQAEEALIVIGVVLAGLMVVAKFMSNGPGKIKGGSFIAMALAVLILAGSLALLSTVDPQNLQNATLCLSILIGVFAVLMVISKFVGTVSPTLLILVAIIGILGLVLAGLALLPADKVLPAALALSAVLLALSVAMGILAVVGPMSAGLDAGIVGLAKMLGVIAVFGVIAGALGALVTQFPQLQQFVDTGIQLLVDIATGLGKIIGGFIGGIASGMMEQMPGVADNLKLFLEKMQAATEVGMFDFAPLAEALAAIALIDFVGFFGSLGSIVNEMTEGKSNVQVFGDDLVALGTSFATYQTAMDTVDGIDIDYTPLTDAFAAITAISLTGFLTSIASLVSELTEGKTNVQVFADDLTALATSFATYQTTMDTVDDIEIDTTGLTEVTDAMGAISLTGFFSAIGSIFSDDGKTAVETFSSDLTTLSESLITWQTTMDGMGDITIDSEGIQKLIDAVNAVPKKDLFDAIGSFFGIEDTTFDDFKTNSGKLGEAITAFSDSLGDIDGDKMTVASSAAKMIGDLGASLKNIDLKSGWFSGDTDFGRFGKAIKPFGTALNEFANSVEDPEKVASVSEAALDVANAGAKMSNIDLSSGDIMDAEKVTQFKEHVDSIIEAVSKASDAGAQNTSGADRLKSAVEKLGSMSLATEDTSGASDKGKETGDAVASGISESSGKLGDALSGALSAAAGAVASTVSNFTSIGSDAVNALANGLTKGTAKIKDKAKKLMTGAINALNNKKYRSDINTIGFNFSSGFAKGIVSGTFKAKVEAEALAAAALEAARKKLRTGSPSRETMKIGEFFGMGFVNGINSQRRDAYRSGASIADQARGGLEKAANVLKRVLTDDMDMSPTIRPVLDLSEIQNGAGMIGSMLNTRPSVALAGNIDAINATVDARRLVTSGDILDALSSLKDNLNRSGGDTYNINGVTYDDGSNISSAVQTLVRAARVERRV